MSGDRVTGSNLDRMDVQASTELRNAMLVIIREWDSENLRVLSTAPFTEIAAAVDVFKRFTAGVVTPLPPLFGGGVRGV